MPTSDESGPHRNERLIFNIGGQRHETFVSTLKAIPGTRLSWIADNFLLLQHSPAYDLEKKEFFFDRNSTCFAAILNYFRTGQLHYPTQICGPSYACELKFWGIDEDQMQSCCWERYTANRDKDAKLQGFKGPLFHTEEDDEDDEDAIYSKTHTYRINLWKFLDDAYSSRPAMVHAYVGYILLFFNILLPVLQSMTAIKKGLTHLQVIEKAEYVLTAYFSLELVLRFALCPNRKEFIKDRMNIVDVISLVPVYLKLLIGNSTISYYTDILAIFRIVKVFRTFRYNYTLQVLVNTLKESLPELSLLVFLMLLLATVFAYASYFIEGRIVDTKFVSIPHSLYWAFITMTTVGYGDMFPESWLGQVVGIMCAICGLLMVAFPVSVVATNFSIYYSYAKARISLPPKKKVKVAADANNFLGQSTIKEKEYSKGHNKVAPMTNGTHHVSNRQVNGSAVNGAPVGPRGNKLPPIGPTDNWKKIRNAVNTMKEKGMLKPKKKMDLAALVMVLSSKGDWNPSI